MYNLESISQLCEIMLSPSKSKELLLEYEDPLVIKQTVLIEQNIKKQWKHWECFDLNEVAWV